MEDWTGMDCRTGETSPLGLLAPYWLVGVKEEERAMAVSRRAEEHQAGFHHVGGQVHSLTRNRCPQPHRCH